MVASGASRRRALLPFDAEMTHRVEWVAWAKGRLADEGVTFTNDGRVAAIAGRAKASSSSSGRSSRTARTTEPSPCWKHVKVQYSCRDCAPSR